MRAPGKYRIADAMAEQGCPGFGKRAKPFSLLIFLRLVVYLPAHDESPN